MFLLFILISISIFCCLSWFSREVTIFCHWNPQMSGRMPWKTVSSRCPASVKRRNNGAAFSSGCAVRAGSRAGMAVEQGCSCICAAEVHLGHFGSTEIPKSGHFGEGIRASACLILWDKDRCVIDLGRKLIHDVLSHGEKTVLSWWLPYTFYVSGPDKDWWLPVSTLTGEIRMNFGVRISSDHCKIKSDTIKFKMIHYSTIVQHHEIIKNSQHRHYNMDHFTTWEA